MMMGTQSLPARTTTRWTSATRSTAKVGPSRTASTMTGMPGPTIRSRSPTTRWTTATRSTGSGAPSPTALTTTGMPGFPAPPTMKWTSATRSTQMAEPSRTASTTTAMGWLTTTSTKGSMRASMKIRSTASTATVTARPAPRTGTSGTPCSPSLCPGGTLLRGLSNWSRCSARWPTASTMTATDRSMKGSTKTPVTPTTSATTAMTGRPSRRRGRSSVSRAAPGRTPSRWSARSPASRSRP